MVIVGLSDAATLLREQPIRALVAVFILACYVVSFVCLHKIRHSTHGSKDALWAVSLLAACAPVVVAIYWLGIGVGTAVSFLEIIAVAIHVVALADV